MVGREAGSFDQQRSTRLHDLSVISKPSRAASGRSGRLF